MASWNTLNEILARHNYTYCNHWNVLFNRVKPGFMLVDSPWPNYRDRYKVGIVYLCEDPNIFYKHLKIKNSSQIDKVRPETLLELFFHEEAILVCVPYENQSLEFTFNNGKIIANDPIRFLAHEVKTALNTKREFIRYAENYFDIQIRLIKEILIDREHLN